MDLGKVRPSGCTWVWPNDIEQGAATPSSSPKGQVHKVSLFEYFTGDETVAHSEFTEN